MVASTLLLSEISIINKKYTRNRRTCQQFSQQDAIPLPSDPISYIKNQHPVLHNLINILARFENYYYMRGVFLTQTTLAKMLGISRQYCNYLLGQLVASGFLLSNYRHKTSCEYKFSRYFHSTSVRDALKHLIPSFKWLSLALLTPVMLQAETISNFVTTQIKSPVTCIKNPYHRLSKVGGLYTSKVVKNGATGHSHRKKRIAVMRNPIIPEIRHIPGVNFTIANQIALSQFPAEAFIFAYHEFKRCKGVRNPFGWFRVVCNKYCSEHGIQPNYQWVLQLEAAYKSNPKPFNIQDESPYLIMVDKPVAKSYQAKYTAPQKTQKQERDKQSDYQKAMERYKASKPADHPINRKTFHDEYTEKEILMELHKLETYTTPEHMNPLIALMGEKSAYAYHARTKQNLLDKLTTMSKKDPDPIVPPKTLDEIDWEYGPNYNDIDLYEEIIEEPIW